MKVIQIDKTSHISQLVDKISLFSNLKSYFPVHMDYFDFARGWNGQFGQKLDYEIIKGC